MSIEAKTKLVSEVKTKVEEFLVVRDVNKVVSALDDSLSDYELAELNADEIDTNSKDLLQAFIDAKTI